MRTTTSLKMTYDHYYTYIKRYERDEGEVFMDGVYNPYMKSKKVPQMCPIAIKGKKAVCLIPLYHYKK